MPGSMGDEGLGRPDLPCPERRQRQTGDERHQGEPEHEQDDHRGEEAAAATRSASRLDTYPPIVAAGSTVVVVSSVRTSPRDGRRGIDGQRAAGHEHGLDGGALEDGRSRRTRRRLDVAVRPSPSRRVTKHDVGRVTGRHGDVPIEGHQNAVTTSDRRVCRERGRGGDQQEQCRDGGEDGQAPHLETSREIWIHPTSTVTGGIHAVIGHPS